MEAKSIEPFMITEVILWSGTEFTFSTFKELAFRLKEAVMLRRISKNKKYKIIIEEV